VGTSPGLCPAHAQAPSRELPEKDVLRNGEIRGDRRLLGDHRYAERQGVGGAAAIGRPALKSHGAPVGAQLSRQHPEERRLARPVLSHERVHDTRPADRHVGPAQSADPTESLVHAAHGQQGHRRRHRIDCHLQAPFGSLRRGPRWSGPRRYWMNWIWSTLSLVISTDLISRNLGSGRFCSVRALYAPIAICWPIFSQGTR
jgi:hypothetical protein